MARELDFELEESQWEKSLAAERDFLSVGSQSEKSDEGKIINGQYICEQNMNLKTINVEQSFWLLTVGERVGLTVGVV